MEYQSQDSQKLRYFLLENFIPETEALIYYRTENLRINISNMNKIQALKVHYQLNEKNFQKMYSNQKKNWHMDQMKLLLYIADKFSFINNTRLQLFTQPNWQTISSFFPNRGSQQCMFKALAMTKYCISQYPWSSAQNQIFEKLLTQIGFKWSEISKQLFLASSYKIYRNSKQCREHYMCFYNPKIKKGIWSVHEDYQLACLYLQYGRKWSKISKLIEGRNENAIKNRFYLLFEGKKDDINRKNYDIKQKIYRLIQKYENSKDSFLFIKSKKAVDKIQIQEIQTVEIISLSQLGTNKLQTDINQPTQQKESKQIYSECQKFDEIYEEKYSQQWEQNQNFMEFFNFL